MEISRNTALEIFGLKESFSKEELNKSYRRLSKITHPDAGGDENLFRLIGYCKEILENPDYNEKSGNKQQKTNAPKTNKSNSNSTGRKAYFIGLPQLYELHYDYRWDLHEFRNCIFQNNIIAIRGSVYVYISPLFKKNVNESMQCELSVDMDTFLKSGFVQFSKTILIPEKLKNYKRLKVRVEFMGETSCFIISPKNTNCFVNYWGDEHESYSYKSFKSILKLKFEI